MALSHLSALLDPSHAVQHRLTTPLSAPVAPTNASAPQAYGVKVQNTILICTVGFWYGTTPLTYSYQWLQNGLAISGATNYQYTVTGPDVSKSLSCRVTATNAAGSASATSQVI